MACITVGFSDKCTAKSFVEKKFKRLIFPYVIFGIWGILCTKIETRGTAYSKIG